MKQTAHERRKYLALAVDMFDVINAADIVGVNMAERPDGKCSSLKKALGKHSLTAACCQVSIILAVAKLKHTVKHTSKQCSYAQPDEYFNFNFSVTPDPYDLTIFEGRNKVENPLQGVELLQALPYNEYQIARLLSEASREINLLGFSPTLRKQCSHEPQRCWEACLEKP